MVDTNIYVAKPARRDMKKLTKKEQQRVADAVNDLVSETIPRGVEKLKGHPAYFRLRVGNFRVIYHLKSDWNTIIILVIRDRKDAFKGLDTLDAKLADALVQVADTILEFSVYDGCVYPQRSAE